MEKATGGTKATTGRKKTKRKGCRRSPVVGEEHKLSVRAPLGSRFKGYDDFVVQDLRIEGRVIRSRRERWVTPEGKLIVAPMPVGLRGHFGPDLVRFVLLQYHQGQVTADRITILLNDLGLVISKRQVLRLLRGDVAAFADEANAALRAGLTSASWITVDDTGARHRGKNGVTTQIGDDRFTRELIWWFYRDLKIYQDNPCPKRAAQLRARFKRIVSKKTGLVTLDRLLAGKDERLRVLDRPDIPLHTHGSENDIRCHVTKRKISCGTWSETGRDARDVCLALMKTCRKLGVPFFPFLGSRLNVQGAPDIVPRPNLISATPD